MADDHKALVERLHEHSTNLDVPAFACEALGEAADAIERLAAECDELQQTFNLMWKADQDAIKLWQAETGKDLMWPDQRKLTRWLLERAERYKAALVGARDIFEAGNVHAAYVIVHGALKETDT